MSNSDSDSDTFGITAIPELDIDTNQDSFTASLEPNLPPKPWDCQKIKRGLNDTCYLNDENKLCQNYTEVNNNSILSCQQGIIKGLETCSDIESSECGNDGNKLPYSCSTMENGAWCMKDNTTILKCEENNIGAKCLKYHNYDEITRNDLLNPLPECKVILKFDDQANEEYDLKLDGYSDGTFNLFCTDNQYLNNATNILDLTTRGPSDVEELELFNITPDQDNLGKCIIGNALGLNGLFKKGRAEGAFLGEWQNPEQKNNSTIYKCNNITAKQRQNKYYPLAKPLTSIELIYTPQDK